MITCPNNYFANTASSQCTQCATGCQSCYSLGLNSCTQCQIDTSNNTSYYKAIGKNSCVATCGNGQFSISTNLSCALCEPYCVSCASLTACSQCQSVAGQAYFYNGSTCIVSCPVGQYGRVSNFTCQACYAACASCNGGTQDNCF